MKILLISAYHAQSHKAWADSIKEMLNHVEWAEAILPAHYFSWRIRGNALGFAYASEFREIFSQKYDLVIATSMTDVAGLKAFLPALATVPWLLYFHENQFDYPSSRFQKGIVEMQMVTLYSALAADVCVFNSAYNRDSFLSGVSQLLKKLPDYTGENCPAVLREKSKVISVPIAQDVVDFAQYSPKQKRVPHIIWAARWEYDKGPDRLLAVLRQLKHDGFEFKLSVLGQGFRNQPDEFSIIAEEFKDHILNFGFLSSREDYLATLAQGDIFLSTALHEFQGLSVIEAVSQGCRPVLPRRQVYPELFGDDFTYPESKDIKAEAASAVALIKSIEPVCLPETLRFTQEVLKPQYESLIHSLVFR
ncbi:tRNA-queuosine alpha-mannosyltransferase domain-containing protein [Marinomonas balearica]|uniref:tRNA-queuosine alpha-mannosyltransferase n=1 Tax=Marinomonas balearica TaxID=491947 RepID=A0A4R6MDV3_9GAMM|nr:DUF3524 domain-containing protein [Marinomonas balearica]TDO99927.1 glycosyltransferase involved in cell wall biosynthesis [Marinomonas balearica]